MNKKLFTVLIAIITALCCVFGFTACNNNSEGTNNGGGQNTEQGGNENNNGNNENNQPTELIETFGLAKEIASINIVTSDGQDITGDEDHQEYKGCAVSVTNGRKGEDFDSKAARVRVRGNNTAGYDKKSFRLKFDKKINLLGLNGGAECKNWVLLACYKDVSFLRDAVTFEFAKQSLAEKIGRAHV